MAYDEVLAGRVRRALSRRRGVSEKKMFGGLAFMLHGHMCCGVVKDRLMVRVGPKAYEHALAEPHARPMDFTGRPMTGMVFVAPAGLATDAALARWIGRAVAFGSSLPPKKA